MMIKSNNLLHVFKHNYVSPAELSEFLKANPNVERRIGCLPSDWLKNINKNDIPRITELVNDIFEKSSLELDSESLGANITKTLNKLLKRSDIKIECAGTGSFKQCHKLTVGDYSYALSFFKPQKYCEAYTNHGKFSEPQYIFTAYKRMSQGRVVKPFMAKVSTIGEENGGYILSQFVKNHEKRIFNRQNFNVKQKTSLTPLEIKLQDFEFIDAQFGYNCSKRACNVINGILYDVGSMSPSEFKLTKPEKRVALNIEQKFISESNILNKAYQNGVDVNKITDYLSKLSDNGTDIYSADARVIFKDLTPDEQKTAIKIIRVQKKLIKFFDGLSCEEQNCYDSAVKNIDITRYTTTSLLKRILYYCFLFE